MNFFQKAFCRCFQAVLRLALPVLPYRSPRVLTSVEAIPGCLEDQNIQNVLVVTDGFLHISGMLEPLKKALTESGIRYTIYDEVVANPTVLNVELARERYVQNGCEALIGFGGGSSIDCAKAVGARIARANMLRAAFLAGGAFSKSYVGYCHAVAHSLGGQYHIAHGLANAVLLPYVLEAYGPAIGKKAKDIAIAMHIADAATPDAAAPSLLIGEIRRMNRSMGIPEKLPGIRPTDIPKLAAYANKEANPPYPVPVLMNRQELQKFYFDVMEEQP